jgi:hypothetical protein
MPGTKSSRQHQTGRVDLPVVLAVVNGEFAFQLLGRRR